MAEKKAIIKQVRGTTLVGRSDSNHWVVMDGSERFGGANAGSSPKELLMMALGGCTANDVIPILQKKRSPVEHVEIIVSGKTVEEHPQVFANLHVEYVFYGDGIRAEDVERAIELSTTKYCSVSAMLRQSVPLTHSYRIEPTENIHPKPTAPVVA